MRSEVRPPAAAAQFPLRTRRHPEPAEALDAAPLVDGGANVVVSQQPAHLGGVSDAALGSQSSPPHASLSVKHESTTEARQACLTRRPRVFSLRPMANYDETLNLTKLTAVLGLVVDKVQDPDPASQRNQARILFWSNVKDDKFAVSEMLGYWFDDAYDGLVKKDKPVSPPGKPESRSKKKKKRAAPKKKSPGRSRSKAGRSSLSPA